MANRYIPIFLKHAPVPRVQSFALLAGIEAAVRAMLVSVFPLAIYEAVQNAGLVSQVYFLVGLASFFWGLMVPWATRHVPRRWMYTFGVLLYLVGMILALLGGAVATPLAVLCNAMATATTFVCFNAYLLDYVQRADLGRTQSLQMVYAAAPWAIGPMLGVWLRSLWEPLPFLVAGGFSVVLLTVFWLLRLGNGKQISRARGPAVNPLAYLGRFMAQPRLIAGWMFAVVRSCGWWIYVVYLPIFCIEAGLGDHVGGTALSISNALLFLTPFMLRMVSKTSLRFTVQGSFVWCGVMFLSAALFSGWPWASVVLLALGSAGLVMLDAAGGLPFLMSVKPSERTEMAAVYSSFRDVSGILTPALAWAVLLAAPVAGIFAAGAGLFGVTWAVAGRMHPRLGVKRPSRGGG